MHAVNKVPHSGLIDRSYNTVWVNVSYDNIFQLSIKMIIPTASSFVSVKIHQYVWLMWFVCQKPTHCCCFWFISVILTQYLTSWPSTVLADLFWCALAPVTLSWLNFQKLQFGENRLGRYGKRGNQSVSLHFDSKWHSICILTKLASESSNHSNAVPSRWPTAKNWQQVISLILSPYPPHGFIIHVCTLWKRRNRIFSKMNQQYFEKHWLWLKNKKEFYA